MVNTKKKIYRIKVKNTLPQVLHLLTRKRAFAVIKIAPEDISENCNIDFQKLGYELYEEKPDETFDRHFLHIGEDVDARDAVPESVRDADEVCRYARKNGFQVTYPTIQELYEMSKEKTLELLIPAHSEQEANNTFVRKLLRIGVNAGQWYITDSFAKLNVELHRIAEDENDENYSGMNKAVEEKKEGTSIADIREFGIYHDIMKRLAYNRFGYGDDFLLEYVIENEKKSILYFLSEAYYNHRWCKDPAAVLNVRIRAEKRSGFCGRDALRFSHPTKYTTNLIDGCPYLVTKIWMDNSEVEGVGYIKRIDKDQIFDNLADLSSWIDFYHRDIHLA